MTKIHDGLTTKRHAVRYMHAATRDDTHD